MGDEIIELDEWIERSQRLFTRDIGFEWRSGPDGFEGHGSVVPAVCRPGTGVVSAGYLATCADIVAGLTCTRAMAPQVAVTVDLRVTRFAVPDPGAFTASAVLRKRGRTLSVAEVDFRDREQRRFAAAVATFAGSRVSVAGMDSEPVVGSDGRPASVPFWELTGCSSPRPGTAAVDASPHTTNPSGALQGGIHAVLAEVASLSTRPAGAVVDDIEVRYLRSVAGRAEAQSHSLGGQGHAAGWDRVEIIEPSSGSLAAFAMVHVTVERGR